MPVGYQILIADGAVKASGTPVTVYGMNITSGGGGGGIVILRNGTSTGGTLVIQEHGTTSLSLSKDYKGVGITFPSGCFVDIDANVVNVTIFYEVVKS